MVVRVAKENPGWGYDRIVGAMANLGLQLSGQTVGNILRRHDIQREDHLRATRTRRLCHALTTIRRFRFDRVRQSQTLIMRDIADLQIVTVKCGRVVTGRSAAVDTTVMNRTTGRQADSYYVSISEGNSDAEVVPEAAGSQTPSLLILRSLLLMENHEKPE